MELQYITCYTIDMGENLDLKQLLELQKQILSEIEEIKFGDAANPPTLGERLADAVTSFLGSWKFLAIQGLIFFIWMSANLVWLSQSARFDPYPFVLLNLVLTFESSFTAPIILLSQNRKEDRDRFKAEKSLHSIERTEKMLQAINSKIKEVKNGNNTKVDSKED